MSSKTIHLGDEKSKSNAIVERMMNELSPNIAWEEIREFELEEKTDNAILSNKFTKEDIQLGVELLGLNPKPKEKKKNIDKLKEMVAIIPPNPGFANESRRTLTEHTLIKELYKINAAIERDTLVKEKKKRWAKQEVDTAIYMHEDEEYDMDREMALNFINKVIAGSKEIRSKAQKKTLNKKVKLLVS